MYNEEKFLPHFRLLLKPATFYRSLPFRWSKGARRMQYTLQSRHQKLIYRVKCSLHLILIVSIIVQVALTKTQNPVTSAICTFTVAMLTLTTVVVNEYSHKDEEATSLINQFILSSRNVTESMDNYERNRKVAVNLLNPGTFLFPLLYILGVSLMSPCLPSNFGSWLLPECSDHHMWSLENSGAQLISKVIFAGINFWIWSFGIHTTVVVGSGVVMIGAMYFRSRLKKYQREITNVRSDNNEKIFKIILSYRQIQLLSRQYNRLHQRAILLAIIIAVVFTQSICIYALAEFHSKMHWINNLLFLMMGLDCFMAIFMLCGTLADVYDVSKKLINQLLRQHRGCKHLFRFHRSCQAIKIRFGMTNFMEKMTPFNFENFSICQAVNMLLVKK